MLTDYNIGTATTLTGITEGTQNTIYHFQTSNQNEYILTLFEKRDPSLITFLTNHLKRKQFCVPANIANQQGTYLGHLCGKQALITQYVDGVHLSNNEIKPSHCEQIGKTLAILHQNTADFSRNLSLPLFHQDWRPLFSRIKQQSDYFKQHTDHHNLLEQELNYIDENLAYDTTTSIIHGDLFPDNVFFNHGQLNAIIDFNFCGTAPCLYDLAIAVAAWCFDDQNLFHHDRFSALYQTYRRTSSIQDVEYQRFPTFLRACALRFSLTRIHDQVFSNDPTQAKFHDPQIFIDRLIHFQLNMNDFNVIEDA